MNNTDQEYFRLLRTILNDGRTKHNRTGIDTIGVFAEQAKFNLAEGFPILTTKKVWFKGIVHELLWFIKGDTNIKYLVDNDVHIWDEWAYARYEKNNLSQGGIPMSKSEFIDCLKKWPVDSSAVREHGELGEGTYGGMWRNFPHFKNIGEHYMYENVGVDQLLKVLEKLKSAPDDRRLIVSAWHPYWVDHCALPPCHCLFHFNTEELTFDERLSILDNMNYQRSSSQILDEIDMEAVFELNKVPKRRLNLLLYQRSCDTFLGVPFNITSYSLLLAMVAHVSNMIPGVFTHTYGDLHIYKNHMEQINQQLSRESFEAPKLWLNPEIKNLFNFKYEDIKLENYKCHAAIKGEVAV